MVNKLAFAALAMACTLLLCACANSEEAALGTYVCEDSSASLTLQDDHRFVLYGPVAVSYAPCGSYKVEEGLLILTTDGGQEVYVFTIQQGQLIFTSGSWLENWVERGTAFSLTDE